MDEQFASGVSQDDAETGSAEIPQKRGALCAEHELRYDPETHTGCVICRRGQVSLDQAGYSWRWAAVGLAIVALAGSGLLFVSARDAGQVAPATGQTSKADRPRLSAVPYGDLIQNLEAILFKEECDGSEDAMRIHHWTTLLAARMKEWESRLSMRGSISEIERFGLRARAEADPEFTNAELHAARRRWKDLRHQVFEPWDFFIAPEG